MGMLKVKNLMKGECCSFVSLSGSCQIAGLLAAQLQIMTRNVLSAQIDVVCLF